MRPIPIVELPIVWTDKSKRLQGMMGRVRDPLFCFRFGPPTIMVQSTLESRICRCQRLLGYRPLPPRTNAESNQAVHHGVMSRNIS